MARDVEGAFRLFLKPLFEDGVASGLTDGQLLERFATGSGETADLAFAILVERHGPMVLRAARGILRDDHEAMDAFQAKFLILVRKGRSLWVRDFRCPIGTIGSRLARGRERLRGRLARRGLAPEVGALVSVLSADSLGAGLPAALLKFTTHSGLCGASGKAGAGTFSAASAMLAENVLRSLLMVTLMSFGAASAAAVGIFLMANLTPKPGVGAQAPPGAAQAPPKPDRVGELTADFPFINDKDRMKDWLEATIGNMRPLIEDEKGARFQSREAIRYKDGTAKLWSHEKKDPVAPTLRHKGPIRELTFFDDSNLLITLSDESVKVWDGLTGEPRKELQGQTIHPLSLSFAAKRFVTMDADRKAATVWDAVTLSAIATLHPTGTDRVVAAGLSGDGKTVVLFRFSPAPSVELWDVTSGLSFAALRLPSSAVAEVFAEGGKRLNGENLQKFAGARDTRFWEVVRSLAPTAGGPKESPIKP